MSHDDDLQRTAGVDRSVSDLRLQEVSELRLGNDPDGGSYKIPTLSDILNLFVSDAPADAQLALHLKGNGWGEMVDQLVETLKRHDTESGDIRRRVFIFDVTIETADRLKRADRSLRVGLSVGDPDRFPSPEYPTIYSPTEVSTVDCWDIVWADEWYGSLYTTDFVNRWRSSNKRIICVSPELHNTTDSSHPRSDSPAEVWRQLLEYGVDGICTDLPTELAEFDS